MFKLVYDTHLLLTMHIQDTLGDPVFLITGMVQPVAWLLPLVSLLEEFLHVPVLEGPHAISYVMPVLLVVLAAKEAVKVGGSLLDTLQQKIVQLVTSSKHDTKVRTIQELRSQQLVSEPTPRKSWQKRIENGKQTLMRFEEGFHEAIEHSEIRNAIRLCVAAMVMRMTQNGFFILSLANQMISWIEKRTNRVVHMFLRDMVMD
ncbi:MAG: hypothetical protein AAGF95_21005 [Chloroflexota bacterium]